MSTRTTTEIDAATGMDAVRIALSSRPSGERSIAWLARQLGLSRGALAQWGNNIPEERLRKVMEITGLSPRILRPDLAELFAAE